MIRLTDPTRIGPALAEIRSMLGLSRRRVAKQIARTTGRTETSLNSQLWTWDVGDTSPLGRKPDLASLGPYLDVLDFDLALVEKLDPEAPRTWPRLNDPPDDVRRVKSETGTIWARIGDGGHYWSTKGWEGGVTWGQVLRWGPVTEIKEGDSDG